MEVSEKDGRKAVLSLHVTFLDLKKRETAARVIFQREYAGVDPYAEKTPTARISSADLNERSGRSFPS